MAQIVLDPKTLHRSDRGSITGVIYFRGDGWNFPEAEWNDFPVAILAWWLDATAKLLTRRSQQETLEFMDGPFELRLAAGDRDALSIECRRRGDPPRHVTSVAAPAFARSLADAAHLLATECSIRGWSGGHTTQLSAAIIVFDRTLKQLSS